MFVPRLIRQPVYGKCIALLSGELMKKFQRMLSSLLIFVMLTAGNSYYLLYYN